MLSISGFVSSLLGTASLDGFQQEQSEFGSTSNRGATEEQPRSNESKCKATMIDTRPLYPLIVMSPPTLAYPSLTHLSSFPKPARNPHPSLSIACLHPPFQLPDPDAQAIVCFCSWPANDKPRPKLKNMLPNSQKNSNGKQRNKRQGPLEFQLAPKKNNAMQATP